MNNYNLQAPKNQPYFQMINQLTESLQNCKSVKEAKEKAVYLISDYLKKYPKELVIDAISEVIAIQAVRINFFILKEEVKNSV